VRVDVEVREIASLPAPSGQHELAWSYILDAVFADAYHAGVGYLKVLLPTAALMGDVEIRALVSRRMPQPEGRAIADLGGGKTLARDATRVYSLGFGTMAPRALRRLERNEPTGFTTVSHLSCFTPAARLWGIPIRLARSANRPDLVDRGMAEMRRSFAAERDPHAYYQLSVWGRA
jgi:hypothetical protein